MKTVEDYKNGQLLLIDKPLRMDLFSGGQQTTLAYSKNISN